MKPLKNDSLDVHFLESLLAMTPPNYVKKDISYRSTKSKKLAFWLKPFRKIDIEKVHLEGFWGYHLETMSKCLSIKCQLIFEK